MAKNEAVSEKKDLEINDQKPAENKKQDIADTPKYEEQLKLPKPDQIRLREEIMKEFEQFKSERAKIGYDDFCDEMHNLYYGELAENEDRQFNLHRFTTKVKVDIIARSCVKAFLNSDPIYSISPRPEYAKQGGTEVCEAQEDFLDYKMDVVIPIDDPLYQAIHNGVLKRVGWLKVWHKVKRRARKRVEEYDGAKDGLEEFERNYGADDFAGKETYIQKLKDKKKISIMVGYKETVYNDPLPTSVDPKDFYCRLAADGYEGLKDERCYIERLPDVPWWSLKKEETRGFFYNIDDLGRTKPFDDQDTAIKKGFENKAYNILECTYWGKIKEDDKEESRMVIWIEEDSGVVIGSILYPWFAVDCAYIPYYAQKTQPGILGDGVAFTLRDMNIGEDALINFCLEAMWIQNTITPICDENSAVYTQFLEKRWVHGTPIATSKGEKINFLDKPNIDINGFFVMLQYLARAMDDASKVSSLQSGRESPIDPDAPASKTLALLQQSGMDIEEYVRVMLPSFNEVGNIFLQLYYQMSQGGESVMYKVRDSRVVGIDPFKTMARADMIARTNIQSQAMTFDFDKLNSKKEDIALLATIGMEPLIRRNPQAVYLILKGIIKNWAPRWKYLVDQILPPLEQFQAEQIKVAIEAVKKYFEYKLQESQMTGAKMEFQPEEIISLINDMQALTVNNPDEKVAKAQEKANAQPAV